MDKVYAYAMRVLKATGVVVLILLLLAAVAAGLIAALGLPWLDRVLAAEVRDEFALPAGSRVVIQRGSLSQTLRGFVPRFAVDSATASLDGLEVEDLHFEAEDIKFDLSQLASTQQAELEDAQRGEISFKVSARALLEFWRPEIEAAGLSKPSIEIDAQGVKVSAVADLLFTEVRLAAKGEFEVDGSRRIRFRAREFEVGDAILKLGKFKTAFSKLTPIVELDRFKLEIRVDELSTSNGYLSVRGNSLPAGETSNGRADGQPEAETPGVDESGADQV